MTQQLFPAFQYQDLQIQTEAVCEPNGHKRPRFSCAVKSFALDWTENIRHRRRRQVDVFLSQ